MKKLFVLCLLLFVFCMGVEVLAYTQTDISNAQFLADKGIIVKQSTTTGYRLDSTITRAEAIGIALKVRGVVFPSYKCKGYFSNVRNNDWICRAAEIAADNGLVTRANARFRPQDDITRAEALAIVMSAGGLSMNSLPNTDGGGNFSDSSNKWQSEVFHVATYFQILDIKSLSKTPIAGEMGGWKFYFYPNRSAARAEVFAFAKNIVEYKAMMSGGNISSNKQTYKNNYYNFSISYPPNSTISGSESDTYIRIQNYPADRETMGLSGHEYYLEIHLGESKICENSIQSPKEVFINGIRGWRGFGEPGGDPGGTRYALCINNKNQGYSIQVTERTQNGSLAEEILDSFNFIN